MKINLFIIGMFILLFSSIANADLIVNQEIITTSNIGVPVSQSFKITDGDYSVLESLEVIAYNENGFATPLYLTIKDEFNLNQTVYEGSKAVYSSPAITKFNLNDLNIISNRVYYLVFTGADGIKLYGEDEATDVYLNGGVVGNSTQDLFFQINGETITITYDTLFEIKREQDNFISQLPDDRYYFDYVKYETDTTLNEGNFWYKWREALSVQSDTITIQKLNSSCSQNVNDVYKNTACWITVYNNNTVTKTYNETFGVGNGKLVKLNHNFNNFLLNGTNTYRIGWKWSLGAVSFAEGYNLVDDLTNGEPYFNGFIGGGKQGLTTPTSDTFSNTSAYYSFVNGTFYSSCNGDFCDVVIPFNPNATEEIDYTQEPNVQSGEVDIIFGDYSNDENKNKFTIGGLFVTILILLMICGSVYLYTSSLFVLLSIMFKILLLCSALYFIPFYIPLVVLMIMVAWKLFDKFFIGGNN